LEGFVVHFQNAGFHLEIDRGELGPPSTILSFTLAVVPTARLQAAATTNNPRNLKSGDPNGFSR
jgi:hypothetical protein